MKVRKARDLESVLKKKGFKLNPEKDHHRYFYLEINGEKQHSFTYFSHGLKEYDDNLMKMVKKQLKFGDTKSAEDFFDCPMSGEDYVKMLKGNNEI